MDLRQPSFFERYQLCRTENKYYSNFNITVEYSSFSKNQLSQALNSVIQNHPILTCNFFKVSTDDDYRNYVIRPFQLDFDDVVQYADYNIDSSYFKYLNSIYFTLDENKPLWKIFVNGNYVTIVCNHTFLDGNSGVAFHNEIISNLNTLNSNCQFVKALSDPNSITSLPEPIDQVSNLYNPPFWFKLSAIAKHYILPKPEIFKNSPISIGQPVNFRTVTFSNEELKIILTKCKSIKLTSYFIECATEVFREYHQDSVKIAIPLNGRRYEDLDLFQICTASSDTIIGPNVENVGEHVYKSLSDDLQSRNPFYYVGLLKSLNVSNILQEKIGSFDRSTMEVSNVGKMKNVKNAWFSQDNGFSSHLQFNLIACDSGLNITLGTFDELEEIMDEYVEKLKLKLLNR